MLLKLVQSKLPHLDSIISISKRLVTIPFSNGPDWLVVRSAREIPLVVFFWGYDVSRSRLCRVCFQGALWSVRRFGFNGRMAMSQRVYEVKSIRYLLIIGLILLAVIGSGCSGQGGSTDTQDLAAVETTVPENSLIWTLVPIGYANTERLDGLDNETAAPGWKYLWVFFALHNASDSYQWSPELMGDMEVTSGEGYVYQVDSPGWKVLQKSYQIPPGANVIGDGYGRYDFGAIHPIAAMFKVSETSSGYSIQSENFGTILLSDIPELTISYADIVSGKRSGSAKLRQVLEKAAKNQGIEFINDSQIELIPSVGDAVPVGDDAEIKIEAVFREDHIFNTDVIRVQLTHQNNNGGYGKQFNVQYYLLTDGGLVVVPESGGDLESAGLQEEVGPGQSGTVTLNFIIPANAQPLTLVATGDISALFALGTP